MNRFLLIVVLVLLPFLSSAKLQGKPFLDSLTAVLQQHTNNDTIKVKLLNRIAFEYHAIDPTKGLAVAAEGLKLATDLGWEKGIAVAHSAMGTLWMFSNDYPQAVTHHKEALKMFKASGNKTDAGKCSANLANVYCLLGDYPLGLQYLFEGLKYSEEAGNKDAIALSLLNIASLYLEMGKYAESQQYFEKAIHVCQEMGDEYRLANCYQNLGILFSQTGNNPAALKYLKMCIAIYVPLAVMEPLMGCYANIGVIYKEYKNYDTALMYQQLSLGLSKELEMDEGRANALANIGGVYLAIYKDTSTVSKYPARAALLTKAIDYLEQSRKLCVELGIAATTKNMYQELAEAYILSGNYKDGYLCFKNYTLLKDSTLSTDTKVKIAELSTQREADLKESQMKLNAILQVKKRNERYFFFLGTGALLLVSGWVFTNYKKQKTISVQLANSNQQLEAANLLLQEEKERSDDLMIKQQTLLNQKEELVLQIGNTAKMKSRFLANISHELRTPVTLLTGMLELLKEKKLKDEETFKDRVQVAFNNSRKLQYMIDEILDLSRLENNDARLHTEPKELAPLLRRMVYAFETFIEKEKLLLHYDDSAIRGAYVFLDEDKFEKIINNLVYNAIKFNNRGGWIRVAARLTDDQQRLSIEIRDSGIGIKPQDLPHIFERFYQGDSSRAKAEGAGIGLSLVKEFTTLLGGEIEVSSKAGEGTLFVVTFPVMKPGSYEPEATAPAAPLVTWQNLETQPLILLVDDNQEMRFYLKEVLGDNVLTAEAANGTEALTWLASNTPDLIISDLMMPEMDGRELITQLKKQSSLKHIPVITLTALASTESQLDLLRLGVDDYIVKPFVADELRARVYNLIRNYLERKQFTRQQAEPGDVVLGSAEADAFRLKLTQCVLAKLENTQVSVYDIAFELALSERQLYRLSKSLTGFSPAQLIKEVRLQKAYELLVSGKITKVEDVANRVGFESPGYFSRQFSERFGKRPTEFL